MTFLDAPVLDVTAGVLVTVLPLFDVPVFLRLVPPEAPSVDAARQTYVRLATPDLRTCVAGWRDGAGVLVARSPEDPAALAAEVHEIARALRVLGDPAVARTYLTLMQPRDGAGDGAVAQPQKGG